MGSHVPGLQKPNLFLKTAFLIHWCGCPCKNKQSAQREQLTGLTRCGNPRRKLLDRFRKPAAAIWDRDQIQAGFSELFAEPEAGSPVPWVPRSVSAVAAPRAQQATAGGKARARAGDVKRQTGPSANAKAGPSAKAKAASSAGPRGGGRRVRTPEATASLPGPADRSATSDAAAMLSVAMLSVAADQIKASSAALHHPETAVDQVQASAAALHHPEVSADKVKAPAAALHHPDAAADKVQAPAAADAAGTEGGKAGAAPRHARSAMLQRDRAPLPRDRAPLPQAAGMQTSGRGRNSASDPPRTAGVPKNRSQISSTRGGDNSSLWARARMKLSAGANGAAGAAEPASGTQAKEGGTGGLPREARERAEDVRVESGDAAGAAVPTVPRDPPAESERRATMGHADKVEEVLADGSLTESREAGDHVDHMEGPAAGLNGSVLDVVHASSLVNGTGGVDAAHLTASQSTGGQGIIPGQAAIVTGARPDQEIVKGPSPLEGPAAGDREGRPPARASRPAGQAESGPFRMHAFQLGMNGVQAQHDVDANGSHIGEHVPARHEVAPPRNGVHVEDASDQVWRRPRAPVACRKWLGRGH